MSSSVADVERVTKGRLICGLSDIAFISVDMVMAVIDDKPQAEFLHGARVISVLFLKANSFDYTF